MREQKMILKMKEEQSIGAHAHPCIFDPVVRCSIRASKKQEARSRESAEGSLKNERITEATSLGLSLRGTRTGEFSRLNILVGVHFSTSSPITLHHHRY